MKNTKNQIQKFELNDNELEMCSGGLGALPSLALATVIVAPIGWFVGAGLWQLGEEIYRVCTVKKEKN